MTDDESYEEGSPLVKYDDGWWTGVRQIMDRYKGILTKEQEMKRNLFNLPEIVTQGEYGIVANIDEPDRQMRMGAKCWLAGGTGGEGWDRFQWLGLTRGHDTIVKWIPTHRMANFRAAWVPTHLRGSVYYFRGSREEMEKMAADLNDFAMEQRKAHPNRRSMKSHHEIKAIPPSTST